MTTVACGVCGKSNAEGARFCGHCGAYTPAGEVLSPARVRHGAALLSHVVWYFVANIAFAVGAVLAFDGQPSRWFLPTLLAATVVPTLWFAVLHRGPMAPWFALKRLRVEDTPMFATVAVFSLTAGLGYFFILKLLGKPSLPLIGTVLDRDTPVLVVYLLIAVVPAIVEELGFRGFVFDNLRVLVGEQPALTVQAALFAFAHLDPLLFPSHFALGYLFGTLRQRTGTLYPSIALHFLWNALAVTLEFLATSQ